MFGFTGKILKIDLSTKKTSVETIDEEFCKKYVGGVGFVARLLYDNTEAKIDALSPGNALVVVSGPLAGTIFPTGSKCIIGAKSPLTGFFGESISTSFFAPELKFAGYDAVVIKGRADNPTYLLIEDDDVQFKDAKHLWGKDVFETEKLINGELGDQKNVKVACIGPAGEKMVRFANIFHTGRRHSGRTGMGAVMGSKNLKAIAIRGTKSVAVSKLEDLNKIMFDFHEKARGPATEKYRTLGTAGNVLTLNHIGILPTRNWQQGTFEKAELVSGEYMKRYVTGVSACATCPIACDHHVHASEGPYSGATTTMDYESLYALGTNCGIDNFPAIFEAMDLCDRYGMDTMSAGVSIAWAMECYEKGILNKKDTDGLDLKFGNHEACIKLISKIAHREGLGDTLAEGVKRASEKIGKGSEHFAIHVKGLELPGYDIRGLKTAALGWAVAARGGCHNRSAAYEPDMKGEVDRLKAEKGRGKLAVRTEEFAALLDALGICKFLRGCFKDFHGEAAKIYTTVTGIEMTVDDLKKAGERIINIKKAFNVREGWTRNDDNLPPRVLKDPIPDGLSKGAYVKPEELDMMLDDYYDVRGWTKNGLQTKSKLGSLGLEDLAREVGV